MNKKQVFRGFPEKGMAFLEELAKNNNREWFQSRKQQYVEHVQEPAQSFVSAFGERLGNISTGFTADTRTNGSGSLMRIYRDIRFRKDKTPYNTQVRMVFWEGKGKKTESPGIYFCFDQTGGKIYSGMHVFPKPMLEIFRDAVIDEEMGSALENALKNVKKAGPYIIGGEHYKRIPRDYDPLHDRAYLLKYNGLYAEAQWISPQDLMSERIVDICYDHCKKMAPLHHWLVQVDMIHSRF